MIFVVCFCFLREAESNWGITKRVEKSFRRGRSCKICFEEYEILKQGKARMPYFYPLLIKGVSVKYTWVEKDNAAQVEDSGETYY